MKNADLQVTIPRAALALAAGAVLGTILLIAMLVTNDAGPVDVGSVRAWNTLVLVSVFALPIFATGLTVVGIPAWWWLHRSGWRSWKAAVPLGFVATFLVVLGLNALPNMLAGSEVHNSASDGGGVVMIDSHITLHGWHELLQMSALMGLVGGVIGFVVWRIAYRRIGPASPAEAPSAIQQPSPASPQD